MQIFFQCTQEYMKYDYIFIMLPNHIWPQSQSIWKSPSPLFTSHGWGGVRDCQAD